MSRGRLSNEEVTSLTQSFDAAIRAIVRERLLLDPSSNVEDIAGCISRATSAILKEEFKSDLISQVVGTKKPIRVYIDGCFDIMHSGHYNAVRQAKALGDILVVGVHSDEEILKHKGPPVMNDEERLETVKACKWADEVVFGTPYDPSLKLLNDLNCDFCVHGDDMPTTADGTEAYGDVKKEGRMKIIKRTEGVSTTDLVGRLLLMTRDHHLATPSLGPQTSPMLKSRELLAAPPSFSLDPEVPREESKNHDNSSKHYAAGISNFLPTTWRISQFSNNRCPKPDDKVIYIDGAFDLFHIGHIEALKKAKALGTFLYCGVHDDNTVNIHKGRNYPIMNLHERVLNVLSCSFVDEVIIGAPWIITKDLIITLKIDLVVTGTIGKQDTEHVQTDGEASPYAIPQEMGIFRQVESARTLTTDDVIRRILDNRVKYENRNKKRAVKELAYLQKREFVEEI